MQQVRPVSSKKEDTFFRRWRSFSHKKEKAAEAAELDPRAFSVGGSYRPPFASVVAVPAGGAAVWQEGAPRRAFSEEAEELEEKGMFVRYEAGAEDEEDMRSSGDVLESPLRVAEAAEEVFGFEALSVEGKREEAEKKGKTVGVVPEAHKQVSVSRKVSEEEGEDERALRTEKPLYVLSLNDTNIESFLRTALSQMGTVRALFIDSTFSHLTPKKWKEVVDKFATLDLSGVREIILKKQPEEARFLQLLKQRAKELGLDHLAFSGLVFDKENMRRLQGILKELKSLSRLSFGEVELTKETLVSFGKMILNRLDLLSQSGLSYTGEALNHATFRYLSEVLKASYEVRPARDLHAWAE